MNVKIQYTIDLEGVPEEVRRLLPVIPDWKNDLGDIYSALEGEVNLLKVMEDIENIRKSMLMADTRLADRQAILEGYNRVKSGDFDQAPAPESAPEEDMSQTLEKGREMLKQLQAGMPAPPPTEKQENDTAS